MKNIRSYIERQLLISKDRLQLTALSGGADSVALLRILLELGYKVEAMHCNFRLRGDESDRDEAFCVELCKKLGVTLHRVHFDTREYAQLHHVSIEMAARDLRYGYFRQLRKDIGAEAICVAHHKDDQTETVLLNLIRGTGLKGLCGMLPRNGDIVRPLLSVTRQEIEDYLRVIGQDYITDSSNFIDDVKRNKLRLNIIPLLKEINPHFTDAISEMAEHVRESLPYTQDGLLAEISRSPLILGDIDGCLTDEKGHSAEFMLFYALNKKGFTKQQISEMAKSVETGRSWQSPTHIAVMDRGRILIEERTEEKPQRWKFPEDGYYAIGDRHVRLTVQDIDENFRIDKSRDVATLDASKIKWPLTLRTIEQGDRFVPFGMRGSRLVSDFLTDNKVSLIERRRQMILLDGTDTPLWLAGWRTDNRFKVTSDTIKVLIVRYIK